MPELNELHISSSSQVFINNVERTYKSTTTSTTTYLIITITYLTTTNRRLSDVVEQIVQRNDTAPEICTERLRINF